MNNINICSQEDNDTGNVDLTDDSTTGTDDYDYDANDDNDANISEKNKNKPLLPGNDEEENQVTFIRNISSSTSHKKTVKL